MVRITCLAVMLSVGAGAQTALGGYSTVASASSHIDSQIGDARLQLEAASLALSRANTRLEQAAAQLPQAQAAAERAQAAADTAQQEQARAEERLAAAQARVRSQQQQIAIVQAKVDALVARIGSLARQVYISGGESQSLEVLLRSRDPGVFALRLEAERRTARMNNTLFAQTKDARAELAQQLIVLRALQDGAASEQAQAQAQAEALQRARDEKAAAQRSIEDLAARRAEAVKEAAQQRSLVQAVYRKLLVQRAKEIEAARIAAAKAEAARLAAEREAAKQAAAAAAAAANGKNPSPSASSPTSSSPRPPDPSAPPATSGAVTRSPSAAVAWAMNWVGGGSQYNNRCLAFVDDAYGVTRGRTGTAIGQWLRAQAAGHGHPGDRNPPIGAQVYWSSGNPARHVALYIGGGMVISTGVDGGHVGIVSMGFLDGWGPYLGWSDAYYG